jgi:RNA methyltransferase, TrmH family
VVAARRLIRRRVRDTAGRFLAEGPQAIAEALARPGVPVVLELFGTPEALRRHADLAGAARVAGVPVCPADEPALADLSETVSPQGLVAVCRHLHVTAVEQLDAVPRLAVVLAGIADPGNAGTVLRTADAAGASAIVFPDGSVDPYNGKCVRAGTGSLFHLELVRGGTAAQALAGLRRVGLTILAADPHGEVDLDEYADAGALATPTGWVFGAEAAGLPSGVAELAHARVRVPIHGRAESLNLAAAAAVCLYASARALYPRTRPAADRKSRAAE